MREIHSRRHRNSRLMDLVAKGVILLALCQLTSASQSTPIPGEIHWSPQFLEPVFAFDRLVGEALTHLSPSEQQARKYLQSYGWMATDAKNMYGGDMNHPTLTGHPLHKFAMIKRLVLYYPRFKHIFHNHQLKKEKLKTLKRGDRMKAIKESDVMRAVRDAENRTVLPISNDLMGAADAVGFIQKIYKLSLEDFVDGTIQNYSSSVVLNDWDCVRIGRACAMDDRWSGAWLWYSLVQNSTTNPEMAVYVTELMKDIIKWHDATWADDDNHFVQLLSEAQVQQTRTSTYMESCESGYRSEPADLKCQLISKGHPFLLLQPLKLEIVLHVPEVYIFHDVLNDVEIRTLQQLSYGNFIRDAKPKRATTYAYIDDDKHPVIETITRRVAMMTGLQTDDGTENATTVDPIKTRLYGPGGHINPHYDVRIKIPNRQGDFDLGPHGDRMATVLFYLNDVIEGGHTAFFNLQMSIKPEKGSAILWFNLKKNGDYDGRFDHAGCPIIVGTKWVALKWIREMWNFQKRPCSLNSNE